VNKKKSYAGFKRCVKLDISEIKFNEFKKRKITEEEIKNVISTSEINSEGEVKRIKSIWNEKEKAILKTIKEITNININTEKITCYVNPYQNGGYYGEDNITVGAYKNPEDLLFVTAHELFHVFYWKKLAELQLTKSVMGKETLPEWKLAEATVHLLTSESSLKRFWPHDETEPYPEIEDLLKKVKPLWKNNSFEDYLKESYKLIKNK
jgi:hypothetical protein